MIIYKYDRNNRFTGTTKDIAPSDAIPRGWTHYAPPDPYNNEKYIGGKWIDYVEPPYEPLPEPVPQSISRRQGKQQLVIAGLDEQVQTAIDGITDVTERKLTQIWYDDANEWERDNTQLASLSAALGLTDTQVDDLFKAAAQL